MTSKAQNKSDEIRRANHKNNMLNIKEGIITSTAN